jgi:hypothetical protein
MIQRLLILFLLLTQTASAGPRQLARSVAHEVKMSFVDIKRHPFAWGLQAATLAAVNFADVGSTCKFRTLGIRERNPILGPTPGCPQVVTYAVFATVAHLAILHAASDMLVDSCYRQAADPNSRWNSTPAHTHDPESCRFAIPTAVALTEVPIHWYIIRNNIHEIRVVEDTRHLGHP